MGPDPGRRRASWEKRGPGAQVHARSGGKLFHKASRKFIQQRWAVRTDRNRIEEDLSYVNRITGGQAVIVHDCIHRNSYFTHLLPSKVQGDTGPLIKPVSKDLPPHKL